MADILDKGLKYWYGPSGEIINGDSSKYNKKLEYLLDNDPDKVISKGGVLARKIIHPIFSKMLPLTTKNKLVVVRRSCIPKDKPVIFVPTHGFRDDIALSLKTVGEHSYLVYASLPDFYYSIDGLALWANGVYMMNRYDKKSKQAIIGKIKKGMELGVNRVILCPEGVWNKDPNLLVLNLWPGIYRICKETGAVVMPIGLIHKDMDIDNDKDKTCYSILGEAIDIANYEKDEGLRVLRDEMASLKYELLEKYSKAKRCDIGDASTYWNSYVKELIRTANGLYDYNIENHAEYLPKSQVSESDVFSPVQNVEITRDNAKVLKRVKEIPRKQKEFY